MRLRGPGDFFGSRQHGLPEMHLADLGADVNVLQQAQQKALELLTRDPELAAEENQLLRQRIDRLFTDSLDRFN